MDIAAVIGSGAEAGNADEVGRARSMKPESQRFWNRVQSVRARVFPRGWRTRVAITSGVLFLGVAGANFAPTGLAWVAHWFHHPDAMPSLQAEDWALLLRLREQLRTFLVPEVSKFVAHPQSYDPWNAAQVVVALGGDMGSDRGQVIDFFRINELGDCGWPGPSREPLDHLGGSGWVMFALASLNAPLRSEQYKCLLGLQSPDGWWPQFSSAKPQRDNASTYATVWLLSGFAAHVERGLVPEELRERSNQAIAAGRAWLIQRRSNRSGPIHWTDYPYQSEVNPAIDEAEQALTDQSISALVIHCLHRLTPSEELPELDTWLSWLPPDLPRPTSSGRSDHWVDLDGTQKILRVQDTARHYRLPWFLIATMDTYPQGSIAQHIAVMGRLRELSNHGNSFVSDAIKQPWVAAELLFSLEYVAKHSSLAK